MLLDTVDHSITPRFGMAPKTPLWNSIAGLVWLFPRPFTSRQVVDLSDRDLADLNLHRADIDTPDPRAVRLF